MHGADLMRRGGSPPNYHEVIEVRRQNCSTCLVFPCSAIFLLHAQRTAGGDKRSPTVTFTYSGTFKTAEADRGLSFKAVKE